MIYHLQIPVSDKELAKLEAGDTIYLSGVIYSARDAAHKRMYENLETKFAITNRCRSDISILYGTVSS
jgi:fumarate hydratase subunit beta